MLYALVFFLVSIMAYAVDSGMSGISPAFTRVTKFISIGVGAAILVFAFITGVTFTDTGIRFFRWRRKFKEKIHQWMWSKPASEGERAGSELRGTSGEDHKEKERSTISSGVGDLERN
jgi:hypothetical protein